VYFDVVVKRVYTVFSETVGKNLRTGLVSQNTLKTLDPAPALCTSSIDRCEFALFSRRSARLEEIGQIGLKPPLITRVASCQSLH